MKNKIFKLFLLLSLLALIVTACAPVNRLAATADEVDWTSLVSVLAYLATGPGAMAFALWAGSWAETGDWFGWKALNPALKNTIVLIVGAVVAFLATLGLQATALVQTLQPWYQVIAAVVLSFLSGGYYLFGGKRKELLLSKPGPG